MYHRNLDRGVMDHMMCCKYLSLLNNVLMRRIVSVYDLSCYLITFKGISCKITIFIHMKLCLSVFDRSREKSRIFVKI